MIYEILNMLGYLVLKLGKLIGNVYSWIWGYFRVPWFDHRFDHLRGPENWYWAERGIFGRKFIHEGAVVLDLCCGDGLFSGLYYSQVAAHVDAVDRNEKALRLARRRYSRKNVVFHYLDALKDAFPRQQYDVIFFFASIEHFSDEAGAQLLQKIGTALNQQHGILFGSTPILSHRGGYNYEHENEFLSLEQLEKFLKPHFAEVELWVSKWPNRDECYFRCTHPKLLSGETIRALIGEYRKYLSAGRDRI